VFSKMDLANVHFHRKATFDLDGNSLCFKILLDCK